MELKHDCIRDLLLALEKNLGLYRALKKSEILEMESLKKYSLEDIVYTISKLKEAGYIKAKFYLGGEFLVSEITYDGHQFLDNVRDPEVWAMTKTSASKVGGASLNILKEIALTYVKQKLGLS
ncbi:DUF2513 domain-containing protein [Bacillus sp. NSP9.1]|uniref:DUF2513 domain-containing protein n=1 Tax=Bacillus sp. NSP9.1 TaxID=1071078 RepID=UPI0004188230|nr:DUF2513 domain-containing protein [Bacillus sp. NSP9.1]QHZ45880.1 DUF2513 domain-containing protein [Bacillus sp. NSP9.1]